MSGKIAQALEKGVRNICGVLNWICIILLFVLMMQGTADVLGRYLFNKPIIGTTERGELILATMIFLGWGYTHLVKGHVNVEFLLSRLPPRAQAITNFVTSFVGMVIFVLIAWQALLIAKMYRELGRLVYVIDWPLAPFQVLITVGAAVLCLVFITDMVKYILQAKRGS